MLHLKEFVAKKSCDNTESVICILAVNSNDTIFAESSARTLAPCSHPWPAAVCFDSAIDVFFEALGLQGDTFLMEDVRSQETVNKLSQIRNNWEAYGSELCFYNSSLTYQWKRSLLSPKIECQRSGRGAS